MTDAGADVKPVDRLRRLLDQPFVGFAPWILLSVVEGPHRLVLAAALACGLAVATTLVGATVGVRPKLLDLTAVVFFGALIAVAALADPPTTRWLGDWAAELSNLAIAVIAGLSLALRHPFTLQYARETTDREYWTSPLFLRINDVITAVWCGTFALIAAVGYIGDGPLHQPDNIWTAWLIQIALVVLAVKFTGWYPDHATGNANLASGGANLASGNANLASGNANLASESPRRGKAHPGDLLKPLAAYLVPVGIVVMIVAGSDWWAGAVLIVVGIVTTRRLHQLARDAAEPPELADGPSTP